MCANVFESSRCENIIVLYMGANYKCRQNIFSHQKTTIVTKLRSFKCLETCYIWIYHLKKNIHMYSSSILLEQLRSCNNQIYIALSS